MSQSHQFDVERVLLFEKEMEKKLLGLAKIENDILIVGSQRKEWLKNISISEKADTSIYSKKISILKAQAELSALQMAADILKMEGHYEVQTLNYLIEATKPIDNLFNGEDENEVREKQLLLLSQKNNQMISSCLIESVDIRRKLGNYNYELTSELQRLKNIVEADQISKVEETQEKLLSYIDKMRANVHQSKITNRRVTSEYLVLRHNSRVAKETLLRSQNEAHLLRSQLQDRIDLLTSQAEMQHEKLEESSKNEIKVLTSDLRTKVMNREVEHEELSRRVKTLSKSKVRSFQTLKREIREYDKKYNELQMTRKHDIKEVTSELKRLRQMIDIAEHKLSLSVQYLDHVHIDNDVEIALDNYLRNLQLNDSTSTTSQSDTSSAVINHIGQRVSHKLVKKLKQKLTDFELGKTRKASGLPMGIARSHSLKM